MNTEELVSSLAGLTGHLQSGGAGDSAALESVRKDVAAALLTQDPATMSNKNFIFEDADLFSAARMGATAAASIRRIAASVDTATAGADQRIFIRDTPVRSSRIAGSIPGWAAGAKLVKTAGPFINADGRHIWIDFYRVVRETVSLYLDGAPLPAIIFTGQFREFNFIKPAPGPHAASKYTVASGSAWISARLLCPAAPADHYCPLKVKGGTITLTTAPAIVTGTLRIQAGNDVQVQLDLEKPSAAAPTAAGDYGIDARNAEVTLPATLSLQFSTAGSKLLGVGDGTWNVYGQPGGFTWEKALPVVYNSAISRVLIPMHYDQADFTPTDCESPFFSFSGSAGVLTAVWMLPAALIDVAHPLAADGSGDLGIFCGDGLRSRWTSLNGSGCFHQMPWIFAQPGKLCIADLKAGTGASRQKMGLWSDAEHRQGTALELSFSDAASFLYFSFSSGEEAVFTICNADFRIDRPVKVNGEPVAIKTKDSWLLLAGTNTHNCIALYDNSVLTDALDPGQTLSDLKPIALDLDNALFTTSPVAGCLFTGEPDAAWKQCISAHLLLAFGVYGYLPTLPDPYLANLGKLSSQFESVDGRQPNARRMWLWLVAYVHYTPADAAIGKVHVDFFFAALNAPVQALAAAPAGAGALPRTQNVTQAMAADMQLAVLPSDTAAADGTQLHPEMRMSESPIVAPWTKLQRMFGSDTFALLDVSSNASQFGVSFAFDGRRVVEMFRTAVAVDGTSDTTVNNALPFIVEHLEVKARGYQVRAFLPPLVAWEPVFNLSPPGAGGPSQDPNVFWNYYPGDGGPTRLINNSPAYVALAPKPLVNFIIDRFTQEKNNFTLSAMTLPFGMAAVAMFTKIFNEAKAQQLGLVRPSFRDHKVRGGLQLRAAAGNFGHKEPGDPSRDDGNMFPGLTAQLPVVSDLFGKHDGSTLGDSVAFIFNQEFFVNAVSDFLAGHGGRGVPVEHIDFSGYGASMFSDWHSPTAEFAATSQCCFDVLVGRTSHEVVQVKSILYPWGIRVVRTITLVRASTGYVYRVDSGWQAEEDGKFDFRCGVPKMSGGSFTHDPNGNLILDTEQAFTVHPGVIRGLYNVRNIKEDFGVAEYDAVGQVLNGEPTINAHGEWEIYTGPTKSEAVKCRAVWFDADIDIENVTQGFFQGPSPGKQKLVAAKKILGYVQLAPSGKPLSADQFTALLNLQGGSIGGPVDCIVDINGSGQDMRISRFDVNASVDASGNPIFVAAARGSVLLPKEGSWSMVQHARGAGDVTPLPTASTVPLIRRGVLNPPNPAPDTELLRIANPLEIARDPVAASINFGMLQTTSTQKALFLTPAFAKGVEKLVSKTPPIFADAYRLMSGNGIFPNIGDAESNFGKAFALFNAVDTSDNPVSAFVDSGFADAGKTAYSLLEITKTGAGSAIQKGMNLLQSAAGAIDKTLRFDIPDFSVPLVDMDALKIYVEYNTKKDSDPGGQVAGLLDFDINSLKTGTPDAWKSRLNNLSMVVDLGSMKRIMKIKGNFNAQQGSESAFEGGDNPLEGLPTPELEFSSVLDKVIQILEILADLSTGDYADMMKRGLKLAMSNSDEIWEYKFEASKDIPLIHFPPGTLYDDPEQPLKLEASLGVGMYFDAALKVTTDPGQLLPTAGAYLQFHGGLSVMCVSLAAATIYAVGTVDLKIACDTKIGPSLGMKFGFGAQIVIGLPVVGNVSVLYMIGVEIYTDKDTVAVTASMLFRGQAELLGGLVGVTITIEAKGTITRDDSVKETDCIATVTFGLDISIFLIIDISFSESWSESRQIA